MDKRVLQAFAIWAKDNLEQQVEVSLKTLGINSDNDFRKAQKKGEFTVIDGDSNSYPVELFEKRNEIINQVTQKGYKNLIEEVAYTWFNRLVALRFIELHNFLPHGFRVLSSTSGSIEPDILKNLNHVKDDLRLDIDKCDQFKGQNKIEELFRYVLIKQCNALSDILPMLFSWDRSYMELLLPKSMLIGDTILTRLIGIPEENFMNDVEIIGWMYQFYISAKKDAVNAAKKTITKDTLPAVTQLFTPDWIVRYMAENSVGRIWMESYPQSQLRQLMNYYVDDPEQTNEVQKKLEEIKYKNVDPINIHIIEPCSGSGHILVYVMDLLYKMYEEKGYSNRDIPTLILKNNLVGLDVDKRAAQLASFALIMKARTLNNRFFRQEYYTLPRVYEIQDSLEMQALDYKTLMKQLNEFSDVEISTVSELVSTFENGKTIGSLIKVPKLDYTYIESVIEKLENNEVPTMFGSRFVELLKILLNQAKILSEKYDVMITNPPYIGISSMEATVKEYASKNYPNSKTDMFAMFMETSFVKPNGFIAMINMHGWMSLLSFEKLRANMLSTRDIISLIHLGKKAFEMINGEVVQTVSFILRNSCNKIRGKFFQLNDADDKEELFIKSLQGITENSVFIDDNSIFANVPGMMLTAYWASENVLSCFQHEAIASYFTTREGMATAGNNLFLRFWYEVSLPKISFHCHSNKEALSIKAKWIPYNKGGGTRDWYGNNYYVVNWENDGYQIKHNIDPDTGRIRSHNYNGEYGFKEGITWSAISDKDISVRYSEIGFLFDSKGAKGFCSSKNDLLWTLGLLNSKVASIFLKVLSPTLDYKVGDVIQIPHIHTAETDAIVVDIVRKQIQIAKEDWDSFEISWDFHNHPLVPLPNIKAHFEITDNCTNKLFSIARLYEKWANECRERFNTLKINEVALNRIFINIYGLQNELSSDVTDSCIATRLANQERDVKSLISYLIGIVMGRYSLDVPGVAYAGGKWNASLYQTYQPDDDGIVPIYRGIGMENGMTAQLIYLIKLIYGKDSYRQNIDFIAESLGHKNNESSEETLNRYLNDGFFPDHLKTYQKCPIYWLFSSGKNSGFKCLVYMHRYTNETLARINSRYFLPESTRIKNDLEELVGRLAKAEGREQVRLEKERQKLAAAYNEAIEYGQLLDHMANQYIELDLDDGVKINYEKFQNIEMVTDSGSRIKKNLLATI